MFFGLDGGLPAGVVELVFDTGYGLFLGIEIDHAGEAAFLGLAELTELVLVGETAAEGVFDAVGRFWFMAVLVGLIFDI